MLVDHVVITSSQDTQWQTEGCYFNPGYTGADTVPMGSIPEIPFGERIIIARRAAMKLRPNNLVNLGVGIPSNIATIAAEEGCANLITLERFQNCYTPEPHTSSRRDHPGVPDDWSSSLGWEHQGDGDLAPNRKGYTYSGIAVATEHGDSGGVPVPLPGFGHSYNPEAILRNHGLMAIYGSRTREFSGRCGADCGNASRMG